MIGQVANRNIISILIYCRMFSTGDLVHLVQFRRDRQHVSVIVLLL